MKKLNIPMKLPSYSSPRISSEINDCSLPLTFDSYSKCSLNCEFCIPEGSWITLVDGSIKKVELIEIGDVLLGYNEHSKIPEATVVEKTMSRDTEIFVTFRLEHMLLRVTEEHPIFTKRGWIAAKYLKVGDFVLSHNVFNKPKIYRKTIELIFSRLDNQYEEFDYKHPLYPIWNMMVQRCHYPTNERFLYYGARGIQVCAEWRDNPGNFISWAIANGWEPGLEIDRIDNDADYFPDNCRFVPHAINTRNKGAYRNSTTGYTGITYISEGQYRYAQIGGFVKTAERAAILRERDAIKSNNSLNFPRIPHAKLSWHKISYIRTQNKKCKVFNFECWPNNNYFAGVHRQTVPVNNYTGVLVHNCFSSIQKCNTPGASEAPLQAVDVKSIVQMLDGNASGEKKLFHDFFFKRRFIFHWGGLADPFCRFERKFGIGYEILKELAERKYPTLFSFKGDTILDDKYLQLFDDYKHNSSFAFQVSIVTADDHLSKTLERGVPSPTRRFEVMKAVSDMGYWTILRLRPYIIGVTDRTIDTILQKGLDAGMSGISTEFYALENRINQQALRQYEVMQRVSHIKDILHYFRTLSPRERGSYKRLNRLVKEPYIKKLYTFCADNNLVFTCSDPDYKELSMSSCCCALPDKHPDNPEFNNFLRFQLTDAMKKARRLYHTTGERAILTFDDVYGTGKEETGFLDDTILSHQNYGCTAHNYAYRKQLTTRHILQAQWNTLFSAASPSRYFHGKVYPIGLDNTGENLAYQYVPTEYELRWKEEGINLIL